MDREELLDAQKKAMSILNYSDRTEWELTDKLRKAGFSDEAVDGALEYVKSFHYLDDERYAMHFVEIYHKSRSSKRLWQDLARRHVPEEYIYLALESVEGGDSAALEKDLQKISGGMDVQDFTYEEKQKIAAKLYRKGFSAGDIRRRLSL